MQFKGPKHQRGWMVPIGFWREQGECTAGTSAIPNLFDGSSPGGEEVAGKWDSDGGVYFYEGDDDDYPGSANGGTWIGSCANTEYEGRWTDFGDDAPNSFDPAEGVWREMSTTMFCRMSSFGFRDGDVRFELRRKSDQTIILTDDFRLEVGQESK